MQKAFTCTIQEHTQKSLEKFNILPLQISNNTLEKTILILVHRPLGIQKFYLILIIFLKE